MTASPLPAYLVVFAALSQVKRVKRVLEADGAYFDIQRSPQCISPGGCSFSIRCTPPALPQILAVARDLGIEPKGTFREHEDQGQIAYLPLAPGDLPG